MTSQSSQRAAELEGSDSEGKEAATECGGHVPFQNRTGGLVLSSHHFSQGPEANLGSIQCLGIWGVGEVFI